ncbi:MAG: DegV family protein [Oscillospiraceae bacterium]|nr:DegV family protein [Oscillospiraceae bacterium]
MNVKIIIDSTADTTSAVRAKCAVVPLCVRFGDTEYVDGVTITHKEFYEKLVESDALPTTSQPTPDAFAQEYQKAVAEGKKAVVLTIASELSGTYQSATIAAMDFPGSVFVVDTRTVAIGAGILAELAVALAEQGADAETIVQRITAERENVRVIAMLDTLEYLKKGGRISKTVAFAGNLLAIKPVVNVQDGKINMLGKARGSKQANNLLVEQIHTAGGVDFDKPVLLGYTGLTDALLQKYITDSAELWSDSKAELNYTPIGSVIGTHAGPGAVAAAFFVKN